MQPRNREIMAAVMEEHGGLDTYLLGMSSRGRSSQKETWGDELVLEAAACLYKRDIAVLSDNSTIAPTNFVCGQSELKVGQPLTLGFVNGNHFVSLTAVESVVVKVDCADIVHVSLPQPNLAADTEEIGRCESCDTNESTNDTVNSLPVSQVRPTSECLVADNYCCEVGEDTSKLSAGENVSLIRTKHVLMTRASLPAADIGYCAGHEAPFPVEKLTHEDTVRLLENHWKPPLNYLMPHCVRIIGGRQEKRYLRHDHLDRYKFLAFSESKMGLFCKACVLFGPSSSGRNPIKLQALVNTPLVRYDRLFGNNGYITEHERAGYHQTAVLRASNFLACISNRSDIASQVDNTRSRLIADNRERLKPIVETVLLCGRQNIPLRGHRDDGNINGQENDSLVHNDGNFRALLRFRVSAGDSKLKDHLEKASKNATYISKTTQNELVIAAGSVIRDQILGKVSKAQFFSLLVDETTDMAKQEQITICLRYVFEDMLHEDFIDYVVADAMTGEGLADTILTHLREFPIELSCMVGQGYDGAAAMSGIFKGVQAVIKRQFPAAAYVHCSSHSLNLCLAAACKQPQIRNAQSVVQEIAVFVNRSARRVTLMRQCAEELAPDSRKTKLVQLCETRWVERHDAIITFVELFPSILSCLEKCQSLDATTSSKAQMFAHSIRSPEFLVAIVVLESVLAITLALSKALQSPSIDLMQAVHRIKDIEKLIQCKRGDADRSFEAVWLQATRLAREADISLEIPRQAARQQHRANIPASDPIDYFRCSQYIPFLDSVLQELHDRFLGQSEAVCHLSTCVPGNITLYSFADALPAFSMYSAFMDSESLVRAEFELWRTRWLQAKVNERPTSAIESLSVCSPEFFPNIRKLLLILATLPVTTATPERTFSTLRLLKSHLRTNMGEDRLAGLTLLYLHRGITITSDQVIDKFAHQSRRREFIL